MKGYVDLVFRNSGRFNILDWKSNRLGTDISAYRMAGMEEAMLQHLYHLQYLIYTVAVDAWLQKRVHGYDYESHFGEVFYVFLRGFGGDPEANTGVYRRRPRLSTIRALQDCLMKGGRP